MGKPPRRRYTSDVVIELVAAEPILRLASHHCRDTCYINFIIMLPPRPDCDNLDYLALARTQVLGTL